MIVWLASYPRSGNHLLRTILRRSFDLGSYTIYQATERYTGKMAEIVGSLYFEDATVEDFVERARSSPDLFVVKTHGPVPEGDACIYIVRDGRASLYSYKRFLSDFENHQVSIDDLILGTAWPGSWQDHVTMFMGRSPENTLFLRYEALASATPPLERVGAFLKVAPTRPFDVLFSDLRALDDRNFGIGHNRVGVETIERDHHEMFWTHCGETMRALGYERDGASPTTLGPMNSTLPPADDAGRFRRRLTRWFRGV